MSATNLKFNVDKCCVNMCTSSARTNPTLSFHKFPKKGQQIVKIKNYFGNEEEVDRLKAWEIALKIKKATSSMKVCSLHFNPEDYLFPDAPALKRYLIKTAIPSNNLPDKMFTSKKKIAVEKRRERAAKRMAVKETQTQLKSKVPSKETLVEDKSFMLSEQESNNQEFCETLQVNTDSSIQFNNSGVWLVNNSTQTEILLADSSIQTKVSTVDNSTNTDKKYYVNAEVQTNSVKPSNNFINFIRTDQELSTVTGLESFQILNLIVECVKKQYGDKFEKSILKMKTRERILMTLTKLKHNISYAFLAVIYQTYTPSMCKTIFIETVTVLYTSLKMFISWPTRDEISKNLPKCFKGFEDTRVVLDCTEVFIKRPKNLCCQLLTYSHYKKTQTFKFMTGVSPAGDITYVSNVYGGKASDSTIFQQSKMKDLLEPGDAVMVDRGYFIDEICRSNQWKLIRPPFLKEKKQFTKEEALLTAKIAAARVHIERSNQRIKDFAFLSTRISMNFLPIIEEIFTVVCAIVNLSSPILKDDKFMKNSV